MKRKFLPLALACVLALSGCAALLERSYGGVEPYADRYWDSGSEDTLRAENYQDLVNSLLMLIEQRSETGAIRCYGEASSYAQARAAAAEVQRETLLGTYLLEDLRYSYISSASKGYSTLTYGLTYREDAEDMDTIMILSDSQSLVDLLRLAVREGHDRLTARFSYDMPREAVTAAVESLWQELCQDELDQQPPPEQDGTEGPDATEPGENPIGEADQEPDDGEAPQPDPAADPGDGTETQPGTGPEDDTSTEPGTGPDGTGEPDAIPEPPPPEYPPCPWIVRFYPDMDTAELVEILLGTAEQVDLF